MIRDITIDQALIELKRTEKTLLALRKARRAAANVRGGWVYDDQIREHAAAKRASLDLTHKLADLRAGR